MYRVVCDNKKEQRPVMDVRDETLSIINAEIREDINKVPSFSFDITATNPCYSDIQKLKTEVIVEDENTEMFRGRCIAEETDFYNTKSISCEGTMAYLLDTKYPPYVHTGSVEQFLKDLLNYHNNRVSEKQKIYLGKVTVTDLNDYIRRESEKYEDIYTIIQEKLVENLGGWIRIRRENEKNYLDYLETYIDSGQTARFGENILDLTKYAKSETIKTVITPLGAQDENGKRIDIASVNQGVSYIKNDVLVSEYGWIEDVVIWDDVTEPKNLLKKAEEYMDNCGNMDITIEITILDAKKLGINSKTITPGTMVTVETSPHGIHGKFVCSSRITNLADPARDKIVLGNKIGTFTETSASEQHKTNGKIEETKKELSNEIEDNKQELENELKNASGLFKTEVEQPDKSVITYYHDKQKLEDSKIQMVFNDIGFEITSDGGKNWYGMQVDGTFISDILKATGIMADWIIAGVLKSIDYEKGESGVAFNLNSRKIEGYLNSVLQDGTDSKLKFSVSGTGIEYAINEVKDGKTYERYARLRPNNVTVGNSDAEVSIESIARGSANVQISNKKTGKSMQIEADNIIFTRDAKNENSKTGRAEFSDGSYLEYINGILVGGRTANGTEF